MTGSAIMPCSNDADARIDHCVADVLRAHAAALQRRIADLYAQRPMALRLLSDVTVGA
jgi:hypothetical protein